MTVFRTKLIKKCTRCPWFSYGHNDPTCGKDTGYYEVIPNSGAYADRGPPKNCPLRKNPETITYKVSP